jgi:hypothetical protein
VIWRIFRSTSLKFHSWGKIAATVTKPKGGNMAFLSSKASVFSKDQKLLGNSGYISKTFITLIANPEFCLEVYYQQRLKIGNIVHASGFKLYNNSKDF